MRVVFFGTAAFAVPILERLVAHGHPVELCVTQPDRPQGRGLKPEPSPVKCRALRLRLPVAQPDRLHRGVLADLRPDVGVVAAYGQLIARDVLDLPAHGMLGVHPSLLPKYRGAAPVAWALLDGATRTGVTIFRLDERLDAGEVLLRRDVAIEPEEDTQTLTDRLARLGAEELLRALEMIEQGRAKWTAQDETQATLAPKLTKAQGRIDWGQPAGAIARLVRATIPWPGATTEWQGKPLKVWAVARGSSAGHAAPGTVMEVGSEAMTVAAGTGAVRILELQPAGRRRMRVKEFLAGHQIQVGDTLGAGGEG